MLLTAIRDEFAFHGDAQIKQINRVFKAYTKTVWRAWAVFVQNPILLFRACSGIIDQTQKEGNDMHVCKPLFFKAPGAGRIVFISRF